MNTASLTEAWKRLRADLLARFPDIDPETIQDTLDGETGALDAVARLIRSGREDEASAAGLKDYINTLTARSERLTERAKARKAAALSMMQEIGVRKIERPDFTASVIPGPMSVLILDAASLPDWAFKEPPPPIPNKGMIRTLLGEGRSIPGAILSNGEPYLKVLT